MVKAPAQADLFIAAITDAPLRGELDLMSVPITGLSRLPRQEPIIYERGGVEVLVTPAAGVGLPTIYDLDVVMWAVSQLAEAARSGGDVGATIRAPSAYDVLQAIQRGVSGREYIGLRQALERLTMTSIRTNMRTKRGKRYEVFHLLERVSWEETDDGQVRGVSITLPSWLHSAVLEGRVLALDPRYFQLTSGLARWLYRVARKMAGDRPDGWRWTMAELHQRSGVKRSLKGFALDVRKLVQANDLPEYALELFVDQGGAECVHAVRRSKLALDHPGREPAIRRNRRDPA